MQNNIKIRNLYIGKIQKQISKLTYSINLLNNLNNVITDHYGGSSTGSNGSDNTVDTQKDLQRVTLFKEFAVTQKEKNLNPMVSLFDVDESIDDLKLSIENLNNNITTLTTLTSTLKKASTDYSNGLKALTDTVGDGTNDTVEKFNKIINES